MLSKLAVNWNFLDVPSTPSWLFSSTMNILRLHCRLLLPSLLLLLDLLKLPARWRTHTFCRLRWVARCRSHSLWRCRWGRWRGTCWRATPGPHKEPTSQPSATGPLPWSTLYAARLILRCLLVAKFLLSLGLPPRATRLSLGLRSLALRLAGLLRLQFLATLLQLLLVSPV